MLEVMGSEEGMNIRHAGHMHLMDPERHVAADGIVGSSGPLAVGHAMRYSVSIRAKLRWLSMARRR